MQGLYIKVIVKEQVKLRFLAQGCLHLTCRHLGIAPRQGQTGAEKRPWTFSTISTHSRLSTLYLAAQHHNLIFFFIELKNYTNHMVQAGLSKKSTVGTHVCPYLTPEQCVNLRCRPSNSCLPERERERERERAIEGGKY